jgi:hypothetical protein
MEGTFELGTMGTKVEKHVKDELLSAYRSAKDCVRRLELLLAEVGCPHRNAVNMSTMGDGPSEHYCRDCGETIVGVEE